MAFGQFDETPFKWGPTAKVAGLSTIARRASRFLDLSRYLDCFVAQALLHSERLGDRLGGAVRDADGNVAGGVEPVLGRFGGATGLLVLVRDSTTPTEVVTSSRKDLHEETVERWDRHIRGRVLSRGLSGYEFDLGLLAELRPLVEQALRRGAYTALVAPHPETQSTWAPAPSWAVESSASGQVIATAGVWGTDSYGYSGVTTAYHAVSSAAHLTVDGHTASLRHHDAVTDSCFLAVNGKRPARTRGSSVATKAPSLYQAAEFDGATSGHVHTHVTHIDPHVTWVASHRQTKVYTDPITNMGDSGAALVNDQNEVVGFALDRTGIGTPGGHSSWVWANAVIQALGITL